VLNDPARALYAALFELNDRELVDMLKRIGARAHVVLGNSDGGDSANVKSTDASAKLLLDAGVDLVRRNIAPGRFAHNKFAVFHDSAGAPERVWTGSINWTETGVCTQNSNGLDIKEPIAAAAFQNHWQALRAAADGKIVENSPHGFAPVVGAQPASGRIWFTPVANAVDLADARALINGAKKGILFLMLNPGPDGLLGPIIERLSSLDGHYDPDLYIRGVLNNFPGRGKDSPADTISLLTSEGKRQDFNQQDLASVLKPGGIDETADWWEKEVANTGKFMVAVHSKVIVIDPAGDDPVVLTGSHNFSARASGDNDDNLVIIRGSNALALSYAVNVMGIYNEYRWRAWRNTAAGKQDHGLKRNDLWLQSRIDQQWLKRETGFWI
jgi:phosphatidylserine/phosphatidylglycerophosphate/cardiolipin synthase-like enzyme